MFSHVRYCIGLPFGNADLPATETKELVLLSVQVLGESDVLARCVVSAKHFAPVTLFAERGIVGGHVYQPTVNHRIMNFGNLGAKRTVEDDVVVTPLLRSMIFNGGKSSFSGNTLMRLFPYEVVPDGPKAGKQPLLLSPAPLAFDHARAVVEIDDDDEGGAEGLDGDKGEEEPNDGLPIAGTPATKANESATSTLSSSGITGSVNNDVPTSVVVRTDDPLGTPKSKGHPTATSNSTKEVKVPRKIPLSRQMLMGSIESTRGRRLSGTTFDRLLEVFNFHRKDKGNKFISPTEIASFLHAISQHNISTQEELKVYVETFKLNRFYNVDLKPIHQQLKTLGTIIRMLVPFRLAAYDGRHRFNLCCYFATGIFLPTSELRPKVVSFNEVATMFGEKGEVKGERGF